MSGSEEAFVPVSAVKQLSDAYQTLLEETRPEETLTDSPQVASADGEYTVYALALEDGYYYVGSADAGECWSRIRSHFEDDNGGSAFTREYPPIEVVEVVSNVDKEYEKTKTLEYMQRFGWQNVRGWAWSQRDLQNPPKVLR